MTVLTWLRDELGKTGTKEGCASGDCGACTVVVAEPEGEQLRYQAINACITPLGNLHGRQLLTVESLAVGETLHPVQRAMADCHGSQCGFCTPGIVMSLYAHRQTHSGADRAALCESLGGNLCRCTGYRPILAAGEKMYEDAAASPANAPEVRDRLLAMAADPAPVRAGRYHAPDSLEQLAGLLAADEDVRLVAGATDLALEWTQGLVPSPALAYTGRVPELLALSEDDGWLEIGAAVSFSDCREALCRHWPDLEELIERLGSLQIRNQGTLGGNIGTASPIGDTPPVLLALGARLRLYSQAGERELPLEDYFLAYRQTALAPGEFIRSVRIPLPASGDWLQAYKISKRLEDDISAVCGAFWLRLDADRIEDVRIAFGGMAEVPRRALAAEDCMRGEFFTEATLQAAGQALVQDFSPISDMRASADYRLRVAGNLFQRLYLARQQPVANLRVTQHA